MDQPEKDRKYIIIEACNIARSRPARPGGKPRPGIPVVIRPPASRPTPEPAPPGANAASRSDLRGTGVRRGLDYLVDFVSHLKQERERRGLSLTDLSEASGLDRGMLSKLENGRIPNPTFFTLWRYATALGERPSRIFFDACRAAEEGWGDPTAPREDIASSE